MHVDVDHGLVWFTDPDKYLFQDITRNEDSKHSPRLFDPTSSLKNFLGVWVLGYIDQSAVLLTSASSFLSVAEPTSSGQESGQNESASGKRQILAFLGYANVQSSPSQQKRAGKGSWTLGIGNEVGPSFQKLKQSLHIQLLSNSAMGRWSCTLFGGKHEGTANTHHLPWPLDR